MSELVFILTTCDTSKSITLCWCPSHTSWALFQPQLNFWVKSFLAFKAKSKWNIGSILTHDSPKIATNLCFPEEQVNVYLIPRKRSHSRFHSLSSSTQFLNESTQAMCSRAFCQEDSCLESGNSWGIQRHGMNIGPVVQGLCYLGLIQLILLSLTQI